MDNPLNDEGTVPSLARHAFFIPHVEAIQQVFRFDAWSGHERSVAIKVFVAVADLFGVK
jgi:hypothetical protein